MPGVGLGGTMGGWGQKKKKSKFNQIWCVSHSHEWQCTGTIIWVPTPWGLGEAVADPGPMMLGVLDRWTPTGACLRTKSKYAGGGYGRGCPRPLR